MSARAMTGMPASRAARASGLSRDTAVEITTTSAPSTLLSAWPTKTRPPSLTRRSVTSEARRSLPDTR